MEDETMEAVNVNNFIRKEFMKEEKEGISKRLKGMWRQVTFLYALVCVNSFAFLFSD